MPVYLHNDKKIYLKVKYPSGSRSSLEENYVDYIYIDDKKKRVFYVGKTESLRKGWLFKQKPMLIPLKKFYGWASRSKADYDEYEVYFAWNYDYKDEDVFDYIPMSEKVEIEDSPSTFKAIVLYTVEDVSAYKFKAKNLNESIKKLRESSERTLDQD